MQTDDLLQGTGYNEKLINYGVLCRKVYFQSIFTNFLKKIRFQLLINTRMMTEA